MPVRTISRMPIGRNSSVMLILSSSPVTSTITASVVASDVRGRCRQLHDLARLVDAHLDQRQVALTSGISVILHLMTLISL